MTINVLDLVSEDEVLEHLRVDDLTPLTLRYGEQALQYCLAYLDRDDITEAADVPPSMVAAMMLVWGDLHSHRSAQTDKRLYVNQAVIRLLDQVRSYRDLPISDYDA